ERSCRGRTSRTARDTAARPRTRATSPTPTTPTRRRCAAAGPAATSRRDRRGAGTPAPSRGSSGSLAAESCAAKYPRPAMSAPFAPGSVSLRIYPHNDLAAGEIVDELCGQARLAAERGFDGVMTAEHHGGFAGYLPNPTQTAGWMLDAMPTGWAAPCPLLLPLRPPAMVAEEIAWLAAR